MNSLDTMISNYRGGPSQPTTIPTVFRNSGTEIFGSLASLDIHYPSARKQF